jgi:TP901 family phage tail tape measure protein
MAEGLLPPVVATLVADIKEFQAKMGEARGEMDSLEAKGASSSALMSKAFLGIGGAVAGVAVGVGVMSLKMAGDMQESMTAIKNTTGMSEDQIKQFQATLLDTAFKSVYSAKDLAGAYGSVSGQLLEMTGKALTSQEAMGLLGHVQDLALASGTDLNTTMQDVVTTMKSFHTPVSQAADVTTALYNSTVGTGISMDTFAQTVAKLHGKLGDAVPAVGEMGGLILDLNKHGIVGSRSLMTMTGAVQKMLDPTIQAKAQLAGVSLNTYDANGKFVGLRNIIEQLSPQFQRMSQEQRNVAASTLFGSSAAQGMTQILMAGTSAYDTATKNVSDYGKAHDAAKNSASDLNNQLKTLWSGIQDSLTKAGVAILPSVSTFLHDATKKNGYIDQFKEFWHALRGDVPPISTSISGKPTGGQKAGQQVSRWGTAWKDVYGVGGNLLSSLGDFFSGNLGAIPKDMSGTNALTGQFWDMIFGRQLPGTQPQPILSRIGGAGKLPEGIMGPGGKFVPSGSDPNLKNTADNTGKTATNTQSLGPKVDNTNEHLGNHGAMLGSVKDHTNATADRVGKTNGHLVALIGAVQNPPKMTITATLR